MKAGPFSCSVWTSRPFYTAGVAILTISSLLPTALAQNLTDGQIADVSGRLTTAAQASWELGTRAQAVLELNASIYSVFSTHPQPPPADIPTNLTSGLQPVLDIARNVVSNRANVNNNTQGAQPLMPDGSAADPASIGIAVLLANWTQQDGQDYAGAAKDQLDFLYQNVPKTIDGAISHRVSELQLWSDFVYMVPPFLAYYGVTTRNRTLLTEAYNQISLYRKYLRDDDANGLWKHVLMGSQGIDEGHWSTGNGWAAAGMLRVLATIKNSEYANSLKNEQRDLANWVGEIHAAMYPHLDPSSLTFQNYADSPANVNGNFDDSASTALLAATVYRIALLWNDHSHLPFAEKTRKALSAPGPNGTLVHFTQDGWLTPVVNPHQYGVEGQESAEGQAFVVQMHAAWQDWVADGGKGANAGIRLRLGSATIWVGVLLAGAMVAI